MNVLKNCFINYLRDSDEETMRNDLTTAQNFKKYVVNTFKETGYNPSPVELKALGLWNGYLFCKKYFGCVGSAKGENEPIYLSIRMNKFKDNGCISFNEGECVILQEINARRNSK